ncbi:hypothetical protein SteCoe_14415 [Stentor coeruleus]|uniref:Uncharacterized protein n=1 Tax=Stentor coeruleus TaxID=5963 RepID=A0A1R2C661_9CILI|nr:hypothetical protein SteCoe_14415 [Stentor coeruleus]
MKRMLEVKILIFVSSLSLIVFISAYILMAKQGEGSLLEILFQGNFIYNPSESSGSENFTLVNSLQQDSNNELPTIDNQNSEYKQNNQALNQSQNSHEARKKSIDLKKLNANFNITNLKTKCIPFLPGFSPIHASEIYQLISNFDCSKNIHPYLLLNKSHFTIECPNGAPGLYALGPQVENNLLGNFDYKIRWQSFMWRNYIELENNEFIILKCAEYQKAVELTNIFLPSVYERAFNLSFQYSPKNFKPFGIHIITLNSLSRQQFYRSLPETTELLNSLLNKSKEYISYDFLINNAQNLKTRTNLVNMLLGKNFQKHLQDIKKLNGVDGLFDDEYKDIQEDSVWKYYEKLGYVTMFSFDNSNTDFCEDIGKKVYTDHKVLGFWKLAHTVFNYDNEKYVSKCLGNKYSHKLMLDYLTKYIENYKGVNKFSFTHFSAGISIHGTSSNIWDQGLKEAIQNIVSIYENSNEDFMIMLVSDQGQKIDQYKYVEEALSESISPVHIIFTKRSLINRLGPETDDILKHNSQKLISRFDWYLSLLHLAYAPYEGIEVNSNIYKEMKSKTQNEKAVSVFLEKIPDDRLCEDVGIPNHLCQCQGYNEIPIDSNIVKKSLYPLIVTTIDHINYYFIDGIKCREIDIEEIVEAHEFRVNMNTYEGIGLIKAVISVIGNKRIRIEFLVLVGVAEDFEAFNRKSDFPIWKSILDGESGPVEVVLQTASFRRIDSNICNDKFRKEINHEACLC